MIFVFILMRLVYAPLNPRMIDDTLFCCGPKTFLYGLSACAWLCIHDLALPPRFSVIIPRQSRRRNTVCVLKHVSLHTSDCYESLVYTIINGIIQNKMAKSFFIYGESTRPVITNVVSTAATSIQEPYFFAEAEYIPRSIITNPIRPSSPRLT